MGMETQAVWEGFRGSLKGYIQSRVSCDEDAEDILQDVFVRIHDNIGGLKDEGRLRSWIYTITRNAITDYYRRRKTTTEWNENIGGEDDEQDGDSSSGISSCVRQMVDTLPDKYREALDLTELKGMTRRELAENLGITLSGAKSRVQRAREKLKDELLGCCRLEFDRRGKVIEYRPRAGACKCEEGDTSIKK